MCSVAGLRPPPKPKIAGLLSFPSICLPLKPTHGFRCDLYSYSDIYGHSFAAKCEPDILKLSLSLIFRANRALNFLRFLSS